jgi:hypothetical protein
MVPCENAALPSPKSGPRSFHALFGLIFILLGGCQTLTLDGIQKRLVPSNQRDWSPQFRALPRAVISGDQIALYNIRNNEYLSEKDFIVQHYDRVIQRSDIRSVDFIVVPFQGLEAIAHTMLSFGLADGTHLAVSVEVRTEKGEAYTTAMGLSNQFEITYVLADERDLVRLRTRHRNAEVYLYPTQATPEQAQLLFVDILQRVNQLADKPEFYDTITNNCTNNLVRHVNRVFPNKIPRAWQVLLSGFSDRYAYDLGLLGKETPFEELRERAHINDLAEQYYAAPDFSQRIRSRLQNPQRPLVEGDPSASTTIGEDSPAVGWRRPRNALSDRWAKLPRSLLNYGRSSRTHRGGAAADERLPEVSIEE